MTREEALMLSAYTGVLLVPDFEDVHRYCEELMGFPILTHEFAEERLQIEIREKLRPRVWALCQTAADNPSVSREQVEKAWRGEWQYCPEDYAELTWTCSRCGEPWTLIDGTPDDNNMDFCPACGAPMTDKAVQMVMERLEALRGETETD